MKFLPASLLLACCFVASCAEKADAPESTDIESPNKASQGPDRDATDSERRPGPDAAETPLETTSVSSILRSELAVVAALSKEEATWLDRNGYPTEDELEALAHIDEEELFLAMHQGNGKAAALLGHKRAAQGDFTGASAAFARGAQLGSIYAREQHAIIELLRVSNVRDGKIVSSPSGHEAILAARMEVARMLGDHRVDRYLAKYTGDLDRSRYSDDILGLSSEFMRQYGMTEAPRAPDPRPNADLWKELEGADPSTRVTIYGRPNTFP